MDVTKLEEILRNGEALRKDHYKLSKEFAQQIDKYITLDLRKLLSFSTSYSASYSHEIDLQIQDGYIEVKAILRSMGVKFYVKHMGNKIFRLKYGEAILETNSIEEASNFVYQAFLYMEDATTSAALGVNTP